MKKVYVITGSTSGIGKALVEYFSQDETNTVFAGYRSRRKLPQDVKNNIKYFYIDMRNGNSVKEAADFIKAQTDHVDTLINAAGGVAAGPIEKIGVDRLKEQFEINTFSHIEFCQNLIDVLGNSKIINVSSMASFGLFPFISPYCASKRALDIFFNAFAIENHKKIKVISVKPGVISTPIWEKSVEANFKYLENCTDYEKELNYIKDNALKNTKKGLPVQKVVNAIKKIDRSNHPKPSYTVGTDAKFAQILSLLPQKLINKLVSFGMKMRMK